MIVSNSGSLLRLLRWQWRNVARFSAFALAAVLVIRTADQTWLRMPVLPLQVVGAALGIFVSSRTNSAYDRWWEGRKLWGRLINVSRMFATQTVAYVRPADAAVAERIAHRHIAYANVLVCMGFALISEAGRVLEDPFNMFVNGLPLSNMSAMIDRNVRESLGESELPEVPGEQRGILM